MSLPSNQDDATLHGSARGLTGLFELHRGELQRFVSARCRDAVLAEDLMQELWLKIASLNPGPIANGRAYLFRMANNLILDHQRSRQRAMARDRQWIDSAGGHGLALADRPDPAPLADEALAKEQENAALHQAIAALPPRAQHALVLHRIEGRGQAEVAQIMGISRSGVEKHLALAIKVLRDELVNCGFLSIAPSLRQVKQQEGDLSQTDKPQ